MSDTFDVDQVEVSASANVAAHATSTLATLPMASAVLPLASGRCCILTIDLLVQLSGSAPSYGRGVCLINGGSPPSAGSVSYYAGSQTGVFVSINGSGDLDVKFTAGASAEDVSVRLTQRWVGTS